MKTSALARTGKTNRSYLFFIVPGLTLYSVLVIIPIIFSIYYSVFEWSGIGPMNFVGLKNFEYLLFGDRMSGVFFNALGNNFKYLLAVLLIITPLQIILAYTLFIKIRFSRYIRTMLFLPYVLSTSIIGFFALLVFDGNIGVLNYAIKNLLGNQFTQAWLGDTRLMFGLFVGIIFWQAMAAGMMIFYADMQSISQDIIEASIVDGCGELRRFFSIILPNMRASVTTNLTLSVIFAMTMFGQSYVIFGPAGGVDNKLDFIAMVFYRYAFGGTYYGTTDIGFGSAISVVMLIIILTLWFITETILKRFRN
ncbi:MAG TPA: sugar ABC transporter permease [Candidatus Limiplasma sp.]|nr:sugar ABC transporter permease [Candidatus Limiplasma sp.]